MKGLPSVALKVGAQGTSMGWQWDYSRRQLGDLIVWEQKELLFKSTMLGFISWEIIKFPHLFLLLYSYHHINFFPLNKSVEMEALYQGSGQFKYQQVGCTGMGQSPLRPTKSRVCHREIGSIKETPTQMPFLCIVFTVLKKVPLSHLSTCFPTDSYFPGHWKS